MISKKLFPIIIFIYFFQYASEMNLNYFNFQKFSKKYMLMHRPSIKKSLIKLSCLQKNNFGHTKSYAKRHRIIKIFLLVWRNVQRQIRGIQIFISFDNFYVLELENSRDLLKVKMSLWCHLPKKQRIFSRISALTSNKRSNQKSSVRESK